jgi:phosphate transport system substrate-binding protein
VKALALSEDGARYVALTRENVLNRTYPLTRTIYIYLNREPANALAHEFLRYVLSEEGQRTVLRQDVYMPLTPQAAGEELSKLPDE